MTKSSAPLTELEELHKRLMEERFLMGGWLEMLDSNWVHAITIEGNRRLQLLREEIADTRNDAIKKLEEIDEVRKRE